MRSPAEIETAFAPRGALDECGFLFLVGIGGAGMSGLAQLAVKKGITVAGVDAVDSPVLSDLGLLGIEISVGVAPDLPDGVKGLVLSDAIDLNTSPEVAAARRDGIPLFRRSQLLGWLLKGRKVAAVTGTHGKTTTTGLLGAALIGAGCDPLVVVGASIPEFGGPIREGYGEWAVVEACEAYDGLRDIDPDLVLLTNLELDHADFHGDYRSLESAVLRFVDRAKSLVFCEEDDGARELASKTKAKTHPYGRKAIELAMPGDHNVLNASGALASAALITGDLPEEAIKRMAAFKGAERRLQVLLDGEIAVVDDYAHHPTEVRASIEALRGRFPNRRLVVVFQPHLYSRTREMMSEFGEALSAADEVILTDIYPAREAPIPGVSSAVLSEKIRVPVRYVPSRHLLPIKVRNLIQNGDIVVGMGAGTIAAFPLALLDELDQRPIDEARRTRRERIAVLYGGDSSEREVSILSGREIAASLERLGMEVELIDASELLLGKGSLDRLTGPKRPDLAFLAVHGTHAEDGAIQGFLELLHIPYTGSGIQASALAMDKEMTKRLLSQAGVRVPMGQIVESVDDQIDLPLPLVVKPNAEGSTVGVGFVYEKSQLCPAISKALTFGGVAIIEEMIQGVEVSTPILCGEILPVVEIAPASGVYDFASKYTPGATEEICPARIPVEIAKECGRVALLAHETLRCEGATRTDMIVRGDDIFFLEINTLPGMTRTSLLPKSAITAGIDFDQLCRRLVEDAFARANA